ncbi:AMP-binding protein [Acinetobacter oleivorans]|uniref:AMP-binding protein n=1 Tax=Acinetobacter oleivorans TaxID=1148157 RepID=UPI0018FFA75F|nr:AMP-binding protein [Acinetobacter oleivorans]MBJ8496234.1 AMP-binding protein [Acinetobacter oleivorans]
MIYYSTYPEVEIPTGSIYDYIFNSLKEEELDRIAVIDGMQKISYGQLRQRIDALAGGFRARGIKQGDVIALHAPNSADFVITFHAILRAGATVTTLNVLYSPAEISSQIKDSEAKLCITTSMFLENAVAGVIDAGLSHEQVIVIEHTENYLSISELISQNYKPPEDFVETALQLAALPYSSGTTGKAKGVMLTHRNLVANIAQCSSVLPIRQDDTVLAVLPFFHIYGMNVIMNLTLRQRGKLVILPKFDLKPFLELIQNEKCSSIYIAPPIAVALTKHPLVKEYDLSSIRTIICGAAPMDEALGAALTEQIPAVLLQGFGMTELSPVSHVTPLNNPDIPVGSIGFAIPNISFKVIDPQTGNLIEKVQNGRTQAGEMLIKGPNVMVGYLNNKEATGSTITLDGYLHTGDIVEVGPQGEVYVVDRLKELIKYKGYQVPPAELEALLLTHPAIADVAVVAHPDENAGEIPRAFIVLQPNSNVNKNEIMAFVATKVAPHKRIRIVDFIEAIPKSQSGKILRKELRGLPLSAH